MSTIELERNGPRAELALNRPEVMNAANCDLLEDLHAALDELEQDPRLRVVMVSGRGPAFSTGLDLRARAEGEIQIGWFRQWEDELRRIEMLPAVTIARVHGYALGGGLQLAMACDLRVAAEDARFGLPAVKQGMIPGTGAYRLPRFIGLGRARRMILTGEIVAAREALAMGLVDWVVAEDQLAARAEEIARGVLEGSRTAQSLSKRLAGSSFETGFDAFCDRYMDYQAQALESDDHREAMERVRQKG